MTIREFVQDEVERQGWKRGTPEFWLRVGAMLAAWNYAECLDSGPLALAHAVERLGKMVEPEVNRQGWRTCNVRVGMHICPDWQDVPRLMHAWAEGQGRLTPDEAYLEFEGIHPFRDGNGRVGKIIHNWRLGTLNEPVLIRDYFGGGNP